MKYITSAKNPIIKQVRKLATSGSYRAQAQETLLDGVHVCESFLKAGGELERLFVARSASGRADVSFVLASVDPARTDLHELPDSLLASLSGVEGGAYVVGVMRIPTSDTPPVDHSALLLEEVQDPGNVGTMLRTAAAAGIGRVYTSSGTANVWSPKVVRAGMGAHFALEIYEKVDLAKLIRAASVPVMATSLHATKTLYECDLTHETAWLFGSEGGGVSAGLLELCADTTITIPQNPRVESLNVATATAVCLFEHVRQQKAHR